MDEKLINLIDKIGTRNEYTKENDYINTLIKVYYLYNNKKINNIDVIIENNLKLIKENISKDILHKKFIMEKENINDYHMSYARLFGIEISFAGIENSKKEYIRLTEELLNKIKESQ